MIHKITFSLKDRESAELLVLVQSAMEDAEKYQPESDYTGIKDSKMALRKLYTGLVNAIRKARCAEGLPSKEKSCRFKL